jgi:DNA-binding transcriptional ArsR family regulator
VPRQRLSPLSVSEAARLFHLLSDPTRLRIVQALACRGKASAGDLAEATGRSRSSVSINLGLLRRAGVVESRREGRWAYYRLSSPFVAALVRALQPG